MTGSIPLRKLPCLPVYGKELWQLSQLGMAENNHSVALKFN